ncbi:MAG: single-stranded-DNA-specific exonuclease RecJ [Desulfuromonadales bacterium]
MEQVSHHKWVHRAENIAAAIDQLMALPGLTLPTAQVLASRGFNETAEVETFLKGRLGSLPDPFLMSGMTAAASRIVSVIEAGEKILVHGDYDVDGISGTSLLVETLRCFGADVDYFIPLRLVEGYGLSSTAIEKAAMEGIKVVLSVDCGITAVEEAALARRHGIDLVITDHHLPGDELPDACAIVDPHLGSCSFPDKNLAGVGVAFFLMIAVRKLLRERGCFSSTAEPDLRDGLDLVALGTIADVVPLVGVNRLLARAGLTVLEKSKRPGVRALKDVAEVKEVNCGAVGFRLAPRLNAAGRLEDAALGVRLLLETDDEAATEAARKLDLSNRRRQEIEEVTLQQAMDQLAARPTEENRTIVLADERWHPGVIGIVASRLVERFHRPVVLIAVDGEQGKGSARSIPGFHLHGNLDCCREHLRSFGGHECAAGLSISSADIPSFALAFENRGKKILDEDDLMPRILHDGELSFDELGLQEVEQLASLAPFGMGNPEPVFLARNLSLRQVQIVGKNHLRFTACQGGYSFAGIGFAMAPRKGSFSGPVDMLFSPALNHYRGRTSVQLKLRDFQPSSL